jgi:formylglycine-generating enzyme required for sulfatase activity
MHRRTVVSVFLPVLLACAGAVPALALQVRITDIRAGGSVVWTNDFVLDGTYSVMRASSLPAASWTTNATGNQPAGAVITQAVSMTVSQRFYRVQASQTVSGAAHTQLFNAVDLATNWMGGPYPWFITNSPLRPDGDDDVAQSGAIPDGKYSWFGAYFAGPIDLSFWWKSSCETNPDTDFVAFYLDSSERNRIYGETDWTQAVHGLGPGQHLAVWKYAKNASATDGVDAAWVDGMTTAARTLVILDGEDITIETDEDTPVQANLRAYAQNGTAQWSIVTSPANGTAVTNGGGPTNVWVLYTPAADWVGTDTFAVEASSGAETDLIAVHVKVRPVNDGPVITEGDLVLVTMDEDASPVAFSLTLHAYDPDTPDTNLLWSILPPGAALGAAGVATGQGYSQAITYVPPGNWNSYTGFYVGPAGTGVFINATSVLFRVCVAESATGWGDTTTVQVTVRPRNDAPTNLVPPSIVGTARVAKVLTAVPGVFQEGPDVTPTPTQYFARAYQWQRSATGAEPWTNIAGATSQTYTLQGDDYSNTVRVVETASDKGEGLPSSQGASAASAGLGPVGLPDSGDLPAGVAFIGAGSVVLGGLPAENAPLRTNYVSAFFMDKYEVSKALWDQVRAWGATNGYTDLPEGQGGTRYNATNGFEEAVDLTHPVVHVNWYDSVKWCNARSEMEGLVPAYYLNSGHTIVFRTGTANLVSNSVDWTGATGYRLPTEAEWEKAARGMLASKLYPWGDTIGGSNANYRYSGDTFEMSGGNVQGTTPIGYYNGAQTPAGPDMANGYGLYDMAGNVMEWCWNRYTTTPELTGSNPRGPDIGTERVARGGAWYAKSPYTPQLRCADRSMRYLPDTTGGGKSGTMSAGLRPVRRM